MKKWMSVFAFLFLFTASNMHGIPNDADPDWKAAPIAAFADPDW
ncbi:hypothetical protein [Brevibacillus borstelensis]